MARNCLPMLHLHGWILVTCAARLSCIMPSWRPESCSSFALSRSPRAITNVYFCLRILHTAKLRDSSSSGALLRQHYASVAQKN